MAKAIERKKALNRSRSKQTSKGLSSDQSIGQEIAVGLEEFADAVRNGGDLTTMFNCREVRLKLHTGAYAPKAVKKTRQRIRCSQVIFAEIMGVSASAVRAWEQGTRPPSRIACRLMDVINRDPSHWIDLLAACAIGRRRTG